MDNYLKNLSSIKKTGLNLLILFLITSFLGNFLFFEINQGAEAEISAEEENIFPPFSIIQGNSLQAMQGPILSEDEFKITGTIKVVITGYSSSPWETDSTPYVTAAGTPVQDGIVANNLYPFGTKIRIPEIYGDKIFVVEDRMNSRKGYYHVDIWFPSYWEALSFGAKRTYVEIIQEG